MGTNMCDKPLSSENSPFAADHRRGDRLGRRPSRPLGCHAQMIQLPSNALLPELGQASLAVTLVGSSVANRFASQASAFNAEVLDNFCMIKPDHYKALTTSGSGSPAALCLQSSLHSTIVPAWEQ